MIMENNNNKVSGDQNIEKYILVKSIIPVNNKNKKDKKA